MRMSPLRSWVGCLVLGGTTATSTPALADWPSARHDLRRTAVSTTGSDIKKPAPYWRARLGGGSAQVYLGDVDQDGGDDVLYIAGGDLVLTDATGGTTWRTGSRGYQQILSVVDLDVDGQLEVVVATGWGVSVVAGKTGLVAWEEPAGELGTPGAFRLGDVNGDGASDLWLDTCGCCEVESGAAGFIYSFKSGIAAPTKLGPPPLRPHCRAQSNTIGAFLGDGHLQMISMGVETAQMFDADGKVLATSGAIPTRSQCLAADVDGVPGEELLCYGNAAYANGGIRGLFALAYRPAEVPALQLLWQFSASALAGGDARSPSRLAVDLDGDGQIEAVVSGLAPDGEYAAHVLDATTGAEIAVVPGVAAGDVEGLPGGRLLLVSHGTDVAGYVFTRSPPALTLAWQLAGQKIVTQRDYALAERSALGTALVTLSLPGGISAVVLTSVAEPETMTAYSLASAPPAAVAAYALDARVSATAVVTPRALSGVGVLALARNDGYLALLDAGFATLNPTFDGAAALPGTFVGGYYTGPGAFDSFGRPPIAGKLKAADPADAVLVVDSRGDLVRYSGIGASIVAPAQPQWRLADSFGAAIRPSAVGAAAIGAYRRVHPLADPPEYVISSVSPDGAELASLALPRRPLWDVLPGDLAADGSTSFVGFDFDGATGIADITVMASTGASVWTQQLVPQAGTQPLAVGDWNQDGAEDVAIVLDVAHVYSGKNGAEIATGTDVFGYFMPILADLDADGKTDMLLQGGYYPASALDETLKSKWTSKGPGAPYPYGALAPCAGGGMLVEGSFSTPSQLAFTQTGGATPGAFTTIVLASGAAYLDVAAAVAAKAAIGRLTDVAVSLNLDGAGSGPTALVGSTDGYLYAVDACTGAFRWAHAFGAPVGSPSFGDTDGDGKDEILVSVADGYLYALKDEILPAPAFVYETDPDHGISDADISDVSTHTTLWAAWAPVAGAVSYEVAVATPSSLFVTKPSWTDVGNVSSAAILNLVLHDGSKYYIGVRAVSAAGRSADTSSNGVLVHLLNGSDGGAGGGAAGGAGGAGTAAGGHGGAGGTGAAGGSGPTGAGGGEGGASAVTAGPGGARSSAPSPAAVIVAEGCACSTPGGFPFGHPSVGGLVAVAFAALRRRRRRFLFRTG